MSELEDMKGSLDDMIELNVKLQRMLRTATVRLTILRDRMDACDESGGNHGLSIFEIKGWIEEQNDLLIEPVSI